ncbi:hypothetical protein AB433_12045 [Croceicoccus naphthovorans]|uniref:Thioredoxin-like fold domain-containing protein n=1 Tax=Croceicoccus naphthovorans TaxID=1348774 RepID=A0A0G3XMC7_9SPHN|nr:hypothetical protein AB433_12045 [Croceicoccus naphthovorans]
MVRVSLSAIAKPIRVGAAILLAGMAFATPASAESPLVVKKTEPGVHRMGGPQAEVTLTEYVSYTCPHCAHFEADSGDALRLVYVGSGRMALEVRHLVRDPVDLTAAMLTNCGPVGRFDRNHVMFMRSQKEWLGKIQSASQAQKNRYATGPYSTRRQAIARDAGFYEMMLKRGYSRTDIDKCLADETLARKLSEMTMSYTKDRGVTGTPSFEINGVLLAGTHDWDSLKPQLDVRF